MQVLLAGEVPRPGADHGQGPGDDDDDDDDDVVCVGIALEYATQRLICYL